MQGPDSQLIDGRTLDFLLWDWLGLEELLARPRFAAHDRDSVAAMLDMIHRLARDQVAPNARLMDAVEPQFVGDGRVLIPPESIAALRAIADAGLFATVFDEALGGLQLPYVIHAAGLGLQMAGSVGTAFFGMLTVANAALIVKFGTAAQIKAFATPAIAGRSLGTMCLSETHAGSALAEIRTTALPDGNDELGRRFRVTGDKMWISGGDHAATENIVHLVLAKARDPDGTRVSDTQSISLFIVPKVLPDGSRNDVVASGINHKLGQRSLPNLAMSFGSGAHIPNGRAGAVGWLVGEVGQGLSQMFQMMNEARICVGLSASTLGLRGYRVSLGYAGDRIQGRRRGTGEPIAIIEHADVKRLLLTQKALAEGGLALALYSAKLIDEEQTGIDRDARAAAGRLLGLLTPVAKSFPSEFMQESLHCAIQVLGGAGYTRDFDVELYYRDNRLNPIHEGTTGIQAIDLVGRKLRRDGGVAFEDLIRRIDNTLARAKAEPVLRDPARDLEAACGRLAATTRQLISEPEEEKALEDATVFLYAFGHVVVAWLWLDQAISCVSRSASSDADFYLGKVRAMRFFIETELPRVDNWLSQVGRASGIAAETPLSQF